MADTFKILIRPTWLQKYCGPCIGTDKQRTLADVEKTAFIKFDVLYDILRMPFGMKSCGTTLLREMKKVLVGLNYIDSYM